MGSQTTGDIKPAMSRQLKKNISFLVIADVISKLLPLMTFPYLTRTLGPEMYGKYGFAINIVGFLMLLASPGFVPYGMRAVAQNAGEERSIGAKIVGLRLIFAIAAMVILVFYTVFLAPNDNQIRLLLLLSGLLMLPSALNLDWLLTGKSIIPPVAIAGVFSQLIYTAAILLFVKGTQSVWVVPVGTLAGELVCISILLYVVTRSFGLQWPSVSRQDFREIVPSALLLGFASLMSMTYDKVDTILLGYFRPMEEVGLYAATYKIMWMVMSFLPILSKVFFPLIAESAVNDQDSQRDSRLYLKILMFLALPLIAGGIVVAEPLIRLIIGDKYAGSGLLLGLLLPNVLAGGLACYYAGMKLVAKNKNREYVIAVTSGAVLNLVLNLIFIPVWGAKAAAVMTCLSQFAVAGIAAWFCRKDTTSLLWECSRIPLITSTMMTLSLFAIMSIVPNAHIIIIISFGAGIYLISDLIINRMNRKFSLFSFGN